MDIEDVFLKHFDTFLNYSLSALETYKIPYQDELLTYYSKLLNYVLKGGKLSRGKLLVSIAISLVGESMSEQSDEILTLGWCVELLQSSFILADDIMDNGVNRRGKPCWHTLPEIGISNGVNDILFTNTLIYRILTSRIKDRDKALLLAELFQQTTMATILGQALDTNRSLQQSILAKGINTRDLFNTIAKNKTAYYSYLLPLELGMIYAGIDQNNVNFKKVHSVSMLLGELFQAQDDFLDCFGSTNLTGKLGSDIQEHKITWLLARALELANEEQTKLIIDNLGSEDIKLVMIVKDVYNQLNLAEEFVKYEEDKCQEILELIKQIDFPAMRNILRKVVAQMKNRSK